MKTDEGDIQSELFIIVHTALLPRAVRTRQNADRTRQNDRTRFAKAENSRLCNLAIAKKQKYYLLFHNRLNFEFAIYLTLSVDCGIINNVCFKTKIRTGCLKSSLTRTNHVFSSITLNQQEIQCRNFPWALLTTVLKQCHYSKMHSTLHELTKGFTSDHGSGIKMEVGKWGVL